MKHNLYIDENCHLENDGQSVMIIGYTKIKAKNYDKIKEEIKALKLKHHSPTELKWNKISPSRKDFYIALIDYFFKAPIEFRCVIVKNKENLDHKKFNRGDHNAFYYKLVYLLLNNTYVTQVENEHRIYLDYKDTRGRERLITLKDKLQQNHEPAVPFTHFQHIHSHENELLQLTDFLIGAISYKARGIHETDEASPIKKEIVSYLQQKSGYSLDDGTVPWEAKFNIFDFQISTPKK